MIIYFGKFLEFRQVPPRKLALQQVRYRRMFISKKVRPAVFKPGPYEDAFGNLRFLGRAKK